MPYDIPRAAGGITPFKAPDFSADLRQLSALYRAVTGGGRGRGGAGGAGRGTMIHVGKDTQGNDIWEWVPGSSQEIILQNKASMDASKAEFVMQHDESVRQKLQGINELSTEGQAEVLESIRKEDIPRLQKMTHLPPDLLINAGLKEHEAARQQRLRDIDEASGLGTYWDQLKIGANRFADSVAMLGESADERLLRANRQAAYEQRIRDANPYLQEQQRLEQEGRTDLLGRLTSAPLDTIVGGAAETVGDLGAGIAGAAAGAAAGSAIPGIGTAVGGLLGSMLGGAAAGVPAGLGGYVRRVADDPTLTEAQKVQAVEEGAGAAMGVGAAANAILFPAGAATRGVLQKAALRGLGGSQLAKAVRAGADDAAVERLLTDQAARVAARGTASRYLHAVPETAVEGATMAAGGTLGENVVYDAYAAPGTPLSEGVAESALFGAIMGPAFAPFNIRRTPMPAGYDANGNRLLEPSQGGDASASAAPTPTPINPAPDASASAVPAAATAAPQTEAPDSAGRRERTAAAKLEHKLNGIEDANLRDALTKLLEGDGWKDVSQMRGDASELIAAAQSNANMLRTILDTFEQNGGRREDLLAAIDSRLSNKDFSKLSTRAERDRLTTMRDAFADEPVAEPAPAEQSPAAAAPEQETQAPIAPEQINITPADDAAALVPNADITAANLRTLEIMEGGRPDADTGSDAGSRRSAPAAPVAESRPEGQGGADSANPPAGGPEQAPAAPVTRTVAYATAPEIIAGSPTITRRRPAGASASGAGETPEAKRAARRARIEQAEAALRERSAGAAAEADATGSAGAGEQRAARSAGKGRRGNAADAGSNKRPDAQASAGGTVVSRKIGSVDFSKNGDNIATLARYFDDLNLGSSVRSAIPSEHINNLLKEGSSFAAYGRHGRRNSAVAAIGDAIHLAESGDNSVPPEILGAAQKIKSDVDSWIAKAGNTVDTRMRASELAQHFRDDPTLSLAEVYAELREGSHPDTHGVLGLLDEAFRRSDKLYNAAKKLQTKEPAPAGKTAVPVEPELPQPASEGADFDAVLERLQEVDYDTMEDIFRSGRVFNDDPVDAAADIMLKEALGKKLSKTDAARAQKLHAAGVPKPAPLTDSVAEVREIFDSMGLEFNAKTYYTTPTKKAVEKVVTRRKSCEG